MRKSKPKGFQLSLKKQDVTITVAIIGAVVTISTTCISAIFGPFLLTWLQERPTPTAETSPTPVTMPSSVVDPSSILESHGNTLETQGNYVVVLPSCNCIVTVTQRERVLIRLRWGATTTELAEQGADFVNYSLIIDGKPIQNVKDYRRPAVYVENSFSPMDPDGWYWVYWDVPTSSYTDTVEATFESTAAINNGENIIPAGTLKNFKVEFRHLVPGNRTP
jgi:hypothetical protein